jgi:hypothetical protein
LVAGCTVTRQSSGITGIQYGARVQRDSGNTSTASLNFWTNLETIDSIPFAGKTVALSFYAKVGANYSPTSSAFIAQLYSGTGTDQNVNVAGFTGSTVVASSTITATTSYVRYTITGTVAASATQLAVLFYNAPTGTAGANDWYEITGVQLELGSVATEFSRNGATIQGELAACQRYLPAVIADAYEVLGFAYSTTGSQYYLKLPTTARVKPTGITVSNVAHFNVLNTGFSSGATTAIAFNTSSIDTASLTVTTTAGSPTLVASQPAKLQSVNASALILFTGCEL